MQVDRATIVCEWNLHTFFEKQYITRVPTYFLTRTYDGKYHVISSTSPRKKLARFYPPVEGSHL